MLIQGIQLITPPITYCFLLWQKHLIVPFIFIVRKHKPEKWYNMLGENLTDEKTGFAVSQEKHFLSRCRGLFVVFEFILEEMLFQ